MSKKKSLWMPIYIGDYLADTTHLTTEQHGAYFLLLMSAWKMGGRLPIDEAQLAAICRMDIERFRLQSGLLLGFFSVIDGFLVQGRLKSEFDKASTIMERNHGNGAKGGRPKTQTEPKPNPDHNPEKTQSQSQSQEELKDKTIAPATAVAVVEKKKPVDLSKIVLPDWLNPLAWQAFVEHRRHIRKPLSPTAAKLAIDKLNQIRMAGHSPEQAIKDSILNGWQGLFPPKGGTQHAKTAEQDFVRLHTSKSWREGIDKQPGAA